MVHQTIAYDSDSTKRDSSPEPWNAQEGGSPARVRGPWSTDRMHTEAPGPACAHGVVPGFVTPTSPPRHPTNDEMFLFCNLGPVAMHVTNQVN